MIRANTCLTLIVATSLIAVPQSVTLAITVVVPPGVEGVEGDERTGTLHFPTGLRIQEVYPANELQDQLEGNMTIVSMRMRPDKTTPSPNLFTDELYELRLSTTDAGPGSLSMTLSDNRGDDELVVYRGPIRWETAGPSTDGPSAFEYVVEFSAPFLFDPQTAETYSSRKSFRQTTKA